MTTVQASTTVKYMAALTGFKDMFELNGVEWKELSSEQRDWTLAERLLEMQEELPAARGCGLGR